MINIGAPPHNCSICYQSYNNERTPLILITCGHTFCKECIEMIFINDSKEVPCPECKQSTFVLEAKSLPKNRALLDVIIFHEEVSRNNKINRNKQEYDSQDREENKNDRNKNINPPTNINQSTKLTNSNNKTHNLLVNYANILNRLEETYNKILEEHSYLTEISDVLITKEVDEALDNLIDIINEYRNTLHIRIKNEFEKVNLIKDFKYSLGVYKVKLELYSEKFIVKNESESHTSKVESNSPLINNENKKPESEMGLLSLDNIKIDNEDKNIQSNHNSFNNPSSQFPDYSFTQFEIDNLINEIKFAELYSITLKHYSKEIYNPCKYFYINKFQIEKLNEDLRKLLQKICDFDENVYKYNLDGINTPDEKRILKELQDACIQSNFRKLRFMFCHLRINPNFIYSDVLDQITYQCIGERETNSNSNSNNLNMVGNNLTINLAGSNNLPNTNSNINNNFNTNINTNIFGRSSTSTTQLRNTNNNNSNRIQGSSFMSNINFKDKITNLYTYLKFFKDKNELNEFLKFLIDEYNYLPLKLEADTSVDIKFGKDFEWKINLNLV